MSGTFSRLGEAEYHADPAPAPSLSASVAHVLLTRSPKHAWYAHPRLNPAWTPSPPTPAMEFGSAVHALFLEGSAERIEVVDAGDWRSKAAQAAREEARKADKIPLLAEKFAEAEAMAEAGRTQIQGTELDEMLTSGEPEVSALWHDAQGVWCRGRLDWKAKDHRLIVDLKTRNASAEPNTFIRAILGEGMDLQAAMYRRAVKAITGVDARFVFVVQETEPPYLLSMVGLKPEWMNFAEHKLRRALETWEKCLLTNRWPGYPDRVAWVNAPAWAEAQWMEQELEGVAA